jgi:DNA repair protein RecO (recombination protein O)
MLTKVEGIVIRNSDYGEGNRIVHLFTRELGKIPLMVRGAKKSKSRFAVASQLFAYGEYIFYGSGNMPSLNQTEIYNTYGSIQKDLMRMSYGSYIIEFLFKLTEDRERNPYVFELLKQTLDQLSEGKDVEIITRIFEMKMLSLAGVSPELGGCVSCHTEDQPFRFSVKEGGFTCLQCSAQLDPHSIPVNPATVRLLRLFKAFDLTRLGSIDVKDETRKQLSQVIKRFIDEHIGVRLKTRDFIEQLHKYDL